MNHEGVEDARIGRLIHLRLRADSEDEARERVDAMCRALLANPVTEEYGIETGFGIRDSGRGDGRDGWSRPLITDL